MANDKRKTDDPGSDESEPTRVILIPIKRKTAEDLVAALVAALGAVPNPIDIVESSEATVEAFGDPPPDADLGGDIITSADR